MATRKKSAADLTREQAESLMRDLGDLQRQIHKAGIRFDERIARINSLRGDVISPLTEQLSEKAKLLAGWAAKHRAEICPEGKKTATFDTGVIQWRDGPPKVFVDDEEAVLGSLNELGLTDFIRVREEIDKEAVLKDPEKVKDVAGLGVVTGAEKMTIKPHQTEIPAVELGSTGKAVKS